MPGTTQTQPVSINPTVTQESRPVPDPTQLTTQALQREVNALKEMLAKDVEHQKEIAGLANQIIQGSIRKIETQILERDAKVEQTAKDVKAAVDAALQAAKEAVSEQNKSNALAMTKSEAAFTKQIDQQQLLMSQTTKATDEKFDDLKTRLTAYENSGKGMDKLWGYMMAGIMAVIALAAVATMVLKK